MNNSPMPGDGIQWMTRADLPYTAPLPPPPTGDYLQWITQNPEAFAAYLHRIYALSQLRIVIITNGVSVTYPIKFSATNALIEINIV